MRLSFGLVLSVLFHAGFLAYALFWSPRAAPTVSYERPVYTVDLLSLAPPPPPKPAPVIEAPPEVVSEPTVPVVEAAPEPVVEVKPAPVVEAVEPEPKVEKISEKKVEKKTVVKKEEKPEPKPEPKPKPKPKPQKTAEQLRKEALAAAQAKVQQEAKQQEAAKSKALQDELAALKKKEGSEVYSHGGQAPGVEGGIEGGVQGATGSGLSEVYSLIVGLAIKNNWRYPSFAGEANLLATVEITLDPEGKILSSRILSPSGNVEFDNSALRAIKETEYVERPRTERDRVLRINFNSQELSE